MKWITRERPKIDRIAYPWLIARFIDHEAEFLYAPSAEVMTTAQTMRATPYDVPGVELTHDGDYCGFDAFIKKYQLTDPAFAKLADIVRAADTDTLEKSPQAAGLLATSLGLSANYTNDHEMLKIGMIVYDALYAWCKKTKERAPRLASRENRYGNENMNDASRRAFVKNAAGIAVAAASVTGRDTIAAEDAGSDIVLANAFKSVHELRPLPDAQ